MDDGTDVSVSSASLLHLNKEELLLKTVCLAEQVRFLQHTLNCLQNDKNFLIRECDLLRVNERNLLNTCNTWSKVLHSETSVSNQISGLADSTEHHNRSEAADAPPSDSFREVDDPNLQEIFDLIADYKQSNSTFPSKGYFFEKGITRYYLNKYGNVRGIKKQYYERYNNKSLS